METRLIKTNLINKMKIRLTIELLFDSLEELLNSIETVENARPIELRKKLKKIESVLADKTLNKEVDRILENNKITGNNKIPEKVGEKFIMYLKSVNKAGKNDNIIDAHITPLVRTGKNTPAFTTGKVYFGIKTKTTPRGKKLGSSAPCWTVCVIKDGRYILMQSEIERNDFKTLNEVVNKE